MSTRPTYEEIADAIQAVLDVGLYELTVTQDSRGPVDDPVGTLARAFERAGLIDAAGVRR